MYRIPEIKDLDVMVRLDDDSWFADGITDDNDPIDVFVVDDSLSYGFSMFYRNTKDNPSHMSHNLLKYAKEFAGDEYLQRARANNSTVCPIPDDDDTMITQVIYNNFFITRPKLWNQGVVYDFYRYVQSHNGFLRDGIGDAEFHTVAICLLQHNAQPSLDSFVKRFDAFPYRHKNEQAGDFFGFATPIQIGGKKSDYWADYLDSTGCGKVPMSLQNQQHLLISNASVRW